MKTNMHYHHDIKGLNNPGEYPPLSARLPVVVDCDHGGHVKNDTQQAGTSKQSRHIAPPHFTIVADFPHCRHHLMSCTSVNSMSQRFMILTSAAEASL